MYVHTCYVLIQPPIPYIKSSRCKRLHKFRPVEILLYERGRPRPPPCNVLKMSFLFFLMQLLNFFESCLNFASRERAPKGPLL